MPTDEPPNYLFNLKTNPARYGDPEEKPAAELEPEVEIGGTSTGEAVPPPEGTVIPADGSGTEPAPEGSGDNPPPAGEPPLVY
jgi:hypothetical protein